MAEELKACPFCGGPMTLKISRSNGHQIFGSHTKECAFSDISACMQEPSDCEWVADEIIKRWNTRAKASQPGEAVSLELVENLKYGGMHIRKWENLAVLGAGTHKLYTRPADQVAKSVVVPASADVVVPASADVVPVPRELAARLADPFTSTEHLIENLRELRALLNGGQK
jgi:hypothetical protein